MFSCPMCAKVFKTRGNLTVHLVSNTKEKPHKCTTCHAAFGQLVGLQTHIKRVHQSTKIRAAAPIANSQCPNCGYKCINSRKLEMHVQKNCAKLDFSCSVSGCGFETKYKGSLITHVRAVHNKDRPYECTQEGCSFKTTFMNNLSRHLQGHSTAKPFVCNFPGCNYSCKIKASLSVHAFRVHSDEKPWKCSICDFSTKYKFRLRQHQDEHEDIKRFHCQYPKCSFAAGSNQQVRMHVERKHRKKDVKCTAQGCNFTCGTLRLLALHSKIHVLPILKCPGSACNFATRVLKALRLHVSSQHKDLQPGSLREPGDPNKKVGQDAAAVEKSTCPFPNCDYQTEFQHRYDRHIKNHKDEKGKYVCKFCSHRFRKSVMLNNHIQRHVGERPFSCSHCEYSTVCSNLIKLHARRKHHIEVLPRADKNEYAETCRTCNVKFSSYSGLVLHSMSHLRAVVVLKRLSLHML